MGLVGRLIAGALICIVVGACGPLGAGSDDPIVVGAVTFPENQIVGEMYALALEEAGYEVDRRFNFQDREHLLPELQSGEVDVAPEYLASLLTALQPNAEVSSELEENRKQLAPLLDESGLMLLNSAAADDTNAFVVANRTAQGLALEKVSDLQPHAKNMTFGGPPECPQRVFCLKGLRDVYRLRFEDFKALDTGGPLTVAALTSGEIDVGLLFSTSGVISDRGFVLLEDDKGLQAAENITPAVRADIMEATDGSIADSLNGVSAELTTEEMTRLNAQVEVENRDFRAVAREFLLDAGLLDAG